MYTIDEVHDMLDQIAEEIPKELYAGLNGGIVLLPECKLHPKGAGNLYIMGEYVRRHDFGRYICIYYGSFLAMYAHISPPHLYEKLRKTLFHEFIHHLESLAGERDLEIKDAMRLHDYLKWHDEK